LAQFFQFPNFGWQRFQPDVAENQLLQFLEAPDSSRQCLHPQLVLGTLGFAHAEL